MSSNYLIRPHHVEDLRILEIPKQFKIPFEALLDKSESLLSFIIPLGFEIVIDAVKYLSRFAASVSWGNASFLAHANYGRFS